MFGFFKVKTKIKQIFLIAFLQSPSHKHQKSVVFSKSVQLWGRVGCWSVQPAIGFCNACVQLLGNLQCPGGHGKPAAKSSSPPQAILRLATMCGFQVCLFGPSRRRQWPVSPLCPASVDHQGLFTALCLQIRLSVSRSVCPGKLQVDGLGSWWHANVDASDAGCAETPVPAQCPFCCLPHPNLPLHPPFPLS